MSITAAGIIVMPLSLILLIFDIKWLWIATLISSTFTSTCAIDLNISQNAIPIFYVLGGVFIIKSIYLILKKQYIFKKEFVVNSLLIFIILCSISIVYPILFSKGVIVTKPSGVREELFFSIQNITQLMYLIFAYLVYIASRVLFYNKKINLDYVTNILRIVIIIVLIMGVVQYVLPSEIFDFIFRNNYGTIYGKYRITSVNNEASFLALFLAPMVGYLVFNYFNKKEVKDLIIIILVMISIKFHSSSSFILGCIVIILLTLIYCHLEIINFARKFINLDRKKKVLLSVVTIIIFAICTLLTKDIVIQFIQKLSGKGESGGLRTLMFKQNIEVFKQFFITGVGFGSLRSADLMSSWLAQVGLSGVGVYLFYIVTRAKILFKNKEKNIHYKYLTLLIVSNIIMLISVPEPYFGYIWIWYALIDYKIEKIKTSNYEI